MIKTIATTKNITVQVPDDAPDILFNKNQLISAKLKFIRKSLSVLT